MTELDDPIAAIIEAIGTLTRKDVLTIVDAVEKFSPERHQALLGARQLAFQHIDGWLDRLNETENAAVRRYKDVSATQADTLELTVFRVALQGATLATMVKPRLSTSDYRRLVKPASKVISWLADESGADSTPPAPEVHLIEDDDQDGDEPSSEESTDMAVATKPKTSGKQAAQKKLANVANTEPVKASNGNGNGAEHAQTEHFKRGKAEGVRVKPTRGGFSVCVIGENHRVLSGHFASPELAKKGAESNGLTVKKMPGQRSEPVVATAAVETKPKPGIQRAAESIKAAETDKGIDIGDVRTKSMTRAVPKPSAKAKSGKK